MYLSIIYPTYNEVDHINELITRTFNVLNKESIPGEIIVVDDNSPDGTGSIVKSMMEKYDSLKLLSRPKKLGLATAFVDGSKLAQGDIICTMEADLSQPPECIPLLLKCIQNGDDIVVGSRFTVGSRLSNVPWLKYGLSRIYNSFFNIFFNTGIKDHTTGYKMYRSMALRNINVNELKSLGFPFYLEILLKAKKLGLKTTEVPIYYSYRRKGSKFNILTLLDYWKSFFIFIKLMVN